VLFTRYSKVAYIVSISRIPFLSVRVPGVLFASWAANRLFIRPGLPTMAATFACAFHGLILHFDVECSEITCFAAKGVTDVTVKRVYQTSFLVVSAKHGVEIANAL
jgi:hypothetical protein